MSERLQHLLLTKQHLVARSGELRVRLGQHAEGLAPVFAAADSLQRGVATLQRHSHLVLAGVVLLLVARPRAAWRWGKRALIGWRALRSLRDVLDGLSPRRDAMRRRS